MNSIDPWAKLKLMMLKMLLMLLNMMLLVKELSLICINPEHKRNLMMPRKQELPNLEWLNSLKLELRLTKLKRKPDKPPLSKHTRPMSFMLKNIMPILKPEPPLNSQLTTLPGNLDMEPKKDFL